MTTQTVPAIEVPLATKIFSAVVLVTAFGYFVDLFDYYIFLVTRVHMLQDFGLSGEALTKTGLWLVNLQFAGMIAGGLFFGVLGDKLGRKQSLLGSILIYSFATVASGLTYNLDVFALLRFLAGFGIAGEVGVGITLICETSDRNKRGLGCTVFTGIGLLGVVAAAAASEFMAWRNCYLLGGAVGLLLLVTRAMLMEPAMYSNMKEDVKRGSLKQLFATRENIKRYLLCIFLASPVMFGVCIVMTLSPELGKALGAVEPVTASHTMIISYIAMVVGEVILGLLSQYFHSRRKVVAAYLVLMLVTLGFGLTQSDLGTQGYYILAGVVGFFMGYWVNFIALAAEQFGTNLRATAATSIPNFARGTVILINTSFAYLKPDYGVATGALIVGGVTIIIALAVLRFIPETFGKDLNYTH